MRREFFLKTLFLTLFLFLLAFSVQAAENKIVIINEIAWMGSTTSAADEWIELKNMSAEAVDLTGWQLSWDGGLISLSGIISGNGFYLLERTDDNSVPDISADLIYTGSLGNSGEDLLLRNSDENVVDSAIFSTGWPQGDNSTKQTMERKCLPGSGISSDWQTSENINGTAKTSNNCQIECVPLEISRQCVADSEAEINYEYNNELCGEDFSKQAVDPTCKCLYSDWVDAECIANGKRQQKRDEESGFSYCTENLTQEINDDSCIVNNDIITAVGRGCYLSNYYWQCTQGELNINDSLINLVLKKINFDKKFDINQKIIHKLFSIYLAKYHQRRLKVIINNYSGNVILIGKGVWFLGEIK